MYLMIENPGVAPEQSFTVLGASTSRGHDNKNVIGKFGSGAKHGVTTLLREKLPPIVMCGTLRLEFGTRPEKVNDGISTTNFQRGVVKYGGKDQTTGQSRTSTEDLGFVVEYGEADWTNIDFAMREFISNAIDRAIKQGEVEYATKWWGDHLGDDCDEEVRVANGRAALDEYRKTARDYRNVRIELVDSVRAKEGVTRVFIPMCERVRQFYANIGKWFLHFSDDSLLNQQILPKRDRNLVEGVKSAVIYRRGVRVREFTAYNNESLFDYNLDTLEMDESRKIDDWQAMQKAGEALAMAPKPILESFFRSFQTKTQYWEHGFGSHSLNPSCRHTPEKLDEVKKNWKDAFAAVAGDKGVASCKANADLAERKGYKPLEMPEDVVSAFHNHGVRTTEDVITKDEREGREVFDATHDAQLAVDYWWPILIKIGMAVGKVKPPVKSFTSIMDAGSVTNGFYRDGVVYISTGLASKDAEHNNGSNLSTKLLAVALEELAHYITGSTDNSRDFQDYSFSVSAALVAQLPRSFVN